MFVILFFQLFNLSNFSKVKVRRSSVSKTVFNNLAGSLIPMRQEDSKFKVTLERASLNEIPAKGSI